MCAGKGEPLFHSFYDPLLSSVKHYIVKCQYIITEYRWGGATSSAVTPLSASDVAVPHDQMWGITFRVDSNYSTV